MFFAAGQVIFFLTYAYLFMQIRSANDQKVLKMKKSDLEPKNPFAPDEGKEDEDVTMTVFEYDMKQFWAAVKTTCMSIGNRVISFFIATN